MTRDERQTAFREDERWLDARARFVSDATDNACSNLLLRLQAIAEMFRIESGDTAA